ncbi:hypothetical protein PIB30_090923 [Stylosanthes scabra]|uniref:Transposase n=1 Tax=Stylosanthes scabra TaxID=79078 RepID=A0ABU6RUW7_9FABA|nr:hypothetical protein [Stylosanthes scabra]
MIVDICNRDVMYLDSAKDTGLRSPRVADRHRDRNRDCGVWVCQWIELWHAWRAYQLVVTAETRFRMAMDLVLSKSTKRRDEICNLVAEHWNKTINKNMKKNHVGPSYILTADDSGSNASGEAGSGNSLTI